MKTKIYLLITFFTMLSCGTRYELEQFDKDKFSEKKTVLDFDAIYADNYHYAKAIYEYEAINNILYGLSKYDSTNNKISIFGKIDDETIKDLRDKGIIIFHDTISPPKKLCDLDAGFQFKHYLFRSNNKAAMHAFGIADTNLSQNILYLITDYLQFKDYNLYKLPTIRYAVGVRAEFRIVDSRGELSLKGINSLSALSANVETGQLNVNISMKTIGVTGLDSRVSIPKNNNFDVNTYSDYLKVIDFIKTMKDSDTISDKKNQNDLKFQPQLIPVLDKYRANAEVSLFNNLEKIELIERKIKKLSIVNKSPNNKNIYIELNKKIDEIKDSLVNKEIENLRSNYNDMLDYNKYLNQHSSIKSLMAIEKEIYALLKDKADNATTDVVKNLESNFLNNISNKGFEEVKKVLNKDPEIVSKNLSIQKELLTKNLPKNDKNIVDKQLQVLDGKEKWIYLGSIDRNSSTFESTYFENPKDLNINEDEKNKDKSFKMIFDANIRDRKPYEAEDGWRKGSAYKVISKDTPFKIEKIEKIPGKNNLYLLWAKINY